MSKIKIQKFLALDKIREQAACKRLILYGAGTAVSSYARIALWLLNSLEIKPTLFIDDDESRWEKEFEGIPVHSPEFLKTLDLSLQTIIITSNYFESIFKSLISRMVILSINSPQEIGTKGVPIFAFMILFSSK